MTSRRLLALAALPLLLAACETPQANSPSERYVVFFTQDSAALDAAGEQIVAQAATRAKAATSQPVTVLGFAGPAGSAAFNQALSDARARHVADHLVAAGVARSRIRVVPRGPVPFDFIPTESRRVEIVVGS
jgi:outer membrane protein OmpA-like peptidoglycan-associated protein